MERFVLGRAMRKLEAVFHELCSAARAAVYEAWFDANAANGGSAGEVDHVYALMRVGTNRLGRYWSQILQDKSIALRVTGVFCHQTPKVHFSYPSEGRRSCELGDLLIVHQHRRVATKTALEVRRAVFIQAKIGHNGQCKTLDKYQEYLYESWPQFELKGRGVGGKKFERGGRDFRYGNSGAYGLVETSLSAEVDTLPLYFNMFPWTISGARRPVVAAGGEDAGSFITNMLFNTSNARGRSALIPEQPLSLSTSSPNNHFDVTVEELLSITAERTLPRNLNRYRVGPRSETTLCFQQQFGENPMLPTLGESFIPTPGGLIPPRLEGLMDIKPGDNGISTLLIETGDVVEDGAV